MNLVEFFTMAVALLSFIISCYVVRRDRKNRMFDLLYRCYERVQDAHRERPIVTVTEFIEMEEDPDSLKAEKHQTESQKISTNVERELDVACYYVYRQQIELNAFFDLFKGWLAGRREAWPLMQKERIKNYFYTWEIIKLCERKKLLPLRKQTSKIVD